MLWRQLILPASIAGTVLGFTEFSKPKKPSTCMTKNKKASAIVQQFMMRSGAPGLSVGVTVDGHKIWNTGFGLADVEQMVPCTGQTVMRIASISKTITAVIAARLVQEGKFDIDKPIQSYFSNFPRKQYNSEAVEITSRQLLCHTSGIRHYRKDEREGIEADEDNKNETKGDPEFLSNKSYRTVDDALEMFQNDDLISKPGEKFNYTTHGYTLLSAVLEKAAGKPFTEQSAKLFKDLGMNHTLLDNNRNIVPCRSRYYYRDRKHKLKNAPEVDNSYKWAAGGFISNVDDLLIFANAMLCSFHRSRRSDRLDNSDVLLNPDTLKLFWKGEVDGKHGYRYALGWYKSEKQFGYKGCDIGWPQNGFWMHTGAAVGASSVLLIKPHFDKTNSEGICVAILVNLHDCDGLTRLALDISEIFEKDE